MRKTTSPSVAAVACVAAGVVLAAVGGAAAQDARPSGDIGRNGPADVALPAPVGSNAVATGQGGVAGTGLGEVPANDTAGKGLSVKGPPGQTVPSAFDRPK